MTLTTRDRITMIKECVTLLDKQDWMDIDLILAEHNMSTVDSWDGSKRDYAMGMVRDVADPDLEKLHAYLTSESDSSIPGQSPFKTDRLRVFFSHLAIQRELVGDTSRALGRFGVDAFVAHDDIEASKEWQQVIEAALSDCDAMVVFLQSDFDKSPWCDQEVGWAMGRRRPLLPLCFDLQPYGFMGKYQSIKCAKKTANDIAIKIIEWLVSNRSLNARLSASFAEEFAHSTSWDFTRSIAPLMEGISSYSDDDLNKIENAAKTNVDVRECNMQGTTGPRWVAKFVKERRAPATAEPWAPSRV